MNHLVKPDLNSTLKPGSQKNGLRDDLADKKKNNADYVEVFNSQRRLVQGRDGIRPKPNPSQSPIRPIERNVPVGAVAERTFPRSTASTEGERSTIDLVYSAFRVDDTHVLPIYQVGPILTDLDLHQPRLLSHLLH